MQGLRSLQSSIHSTTTSEHPKKNNTPLNNTRTAQTVRTCSKMATLPREANEPTPTQAFRFLDLPDAVRNRIYQLSVCQFSTVQTLAHVRLPPICAVSKQVREEALPIFFATTTFEIYTVGDFANRDQHGCGDEEKSGGLHLSARAEELLAMTANAIHIRHVVLRICNCDAKFIQVILEAVRPDSTFYEIGKVIKQCFPRMYLHFKKETRASLIDKMLTVSVDVSFDGETVKWSSVKEDRHPDRRFINSTDACDVDEPVREMGQEAIERGTSAGSQGFTIADLQTIMDKLRYEDLRNGEQDFLQDDL